MPNVSESAEIYRRLSAVEQAINSHTAECTVRNEDIKEWRREAHADIQSLKLDRAKLFGIYMAGSAIASALGTGGVIALLRVLGKG